MRSQPFRRRPTIPSPTNNPNRSSSSSGSRKKSPTTKDAFPLKETTKPRPTPRSRSTAVSSGTTNNNLVMGQVKLLKRGETLPSPPFSSGPPSSKVDSTPPMKQRVQKTNYAAAGKKKIGFLVAGVSEELFPKQVHFPDCYAGSAFVSSPPPSSLPVPAFFKKKNVTLGDDKNNSTSTDDATSDLLKLLRLDLS